SRERRHARSRCRGAGGRASSAGRGPASRTLDGVTGAESREESGIASAELHVERLRPLFALSRLEHHLIALAQVLERDPRREPRAVEEHVVRPVVGGYEAEPLVAHDALDGAGHRARLYARRVLLASCARHLLGRTKRRARPPAAGSPWRPRLWRRSAGGGAAAATSA